MNEKELDIELDKIHEEGDEMLIPHTLVNEMFCIALEKEIKKYTEIPEKIEKKRDPFSEWARQL